MSRQAGWVESTAGLTDNEQIPTPFHEVQRHERQQFLIGHAVRDHS